jgi:hypothetical protein
MKNPSIKTLLKPFASFLLLATLPALSQTAIKLQPRITAPIENGSRVTLQGSHPPKADPGSDIGAVSPSLKLQGMSLVFSMTLAQQQAIAALIAGQQNPASPLYRQWLTPETYAAQFGVADADIATAEGWLQSQGFSVDGVSRSHNRIFFSGTAAQVESAFAAPIHNFRATGETESHYAPAADLSIPSALASSVMAIGNISSFRPQSRMKKHTPMADPAVAKPNFTSGQSGNYFISPGDINIIYDVNAAYNAGWTGNGQTIVIIGQSEVLASDILAFQTASGITPAPRTPTYTLVPNSGTAYFSSGDEGESDLDIEYSSTIGKGAQVNFIYTGNNTNYDVFDSLQYAVDNKIGNIISSSYGACEPALGLSNYQMLDTIVQQGAVQGQTILSAAGDDGSTDCYGEYTAGSTSNYQLAVDYPASSAYVTAMGGSEFPVAYTTAGNTTYFSTNGTTDVIASAKSYIPEQVWNDDVAQYDSDITQGVSPSPASGGGGVSIYTARPSWQTGTIGGVAIPAGSFRLVPDISLDAALDSAPLLYCSSDTDTGVTGSCSHGFRDINDTDLTVAGGTSFDGPIFSGMLALINQATGNSYEGVINETLYTLAANSTTYGKAFHDIALVGNECLAPAAECGTGVQTTDYSAITGYDEASGLGSIDLFNLMSAWPGYGTVIPGPSISASVAAALAISPGTNATSTVTVAPLGGFTGAVTFTVTALPTLAYACYSLPGATISGTTAATSTLTIETNQATCGSGYNSLVKTGGILKAANQPVPAKSHRAPLDAVMAGLLFAGLWLNRRGLRNLRRTSLPIALLALLGLGAFGLSGCSSSAAATVTGGAPNSTAAGTYTVTVTATSSTTSTVTSMTSFTLTVI